MSTNARVRTANGSRFYTRSGEPCFEIPKAKGNGMKAPNIVDARKLGLLPSVTSILRILDKPALNEWKIEQACLAVLTSPRKDGEKLDDFVHRILHEEQVQDEQAKIARDTGTQIHDAIACALTGQPWDHSLEHFVNPVVQWQKATGLVRWTEKVLVGKNYAGRADALIEHTLMKSLLLTDFKTTATLPEKDSWPEHKIQTAMYAAGLGNTGDNKVITCNVYISTKVPGDIAVFAQADWLTTFHMAAQPLIELWSYINNYYPTWTT